MVVGLVIVVERLREIDPAVNVIQSGDPVTPINLSNFQCLGGDNRNKLVD